MKIGEIMASDREITLNEGKKAVTIMVANKGDRPVHRHSHTHSIQELPARLTDDGSYGTKGVVTAALDDKCV